MGIATNAFSSFAVRELDGAKSFYGDTLDLTVKDEFMGTLGIELPGGTTVMVYRKPDFGPATFTVRNLQVADIEAAVDPLAAAGVQTQHYPGFDQDAKGIARGEGPTIALEHGSQRRHHRHPGGRPGLTLPGMPIDGSRPMPSLVPCHGSALNASRSPCGQRSTGG